ncbi:ATP-dependent DNA/RNA helicase [Endocarpon pusillum]|uniref:RNA helicase n=1 Tax=Endocarpon pusillum TaxID=364733 RepID=A0A8H7A9Q1_9EURO|nr:ATP-dependent DNA/RNA helicase [Endocarpon pusillum]
MTKRKLDENDIPAEASTHETQNSALEFADLKLDARLLRAVFKEKFTKPTPVQTEAIPLALAGKDILAKADTGSGKTAAYVLPILQALLHRKARSPLEKSISALVLVPTRELAEQIHRVFVSFSLFCAKEVRSVNITQRVSDDVLRSMLADLPDIVIATPGRASQSLNSATFSLEKLTHFVIDEADLVLSYGYEADLDAISKALPRGVQTFLMSATFTAEVETLRGLFCRDPAILELGGSQKEGTGVSQYVVKCAEDEKFLLAYVIFKLHLIKGKCIIFVSDVDRSYRLKLFLEQFGVRSCVLNSELPVNSRIHALEEFNKGVYDNIIAADDQEVLGGIASRKASGRDPESEEVVNPQDESDQEPGERAIKKRKLTSKHKDYGISRGIDFKDIACVLNFDLPSSSKSYTHRIGRTARAGKSGMALSFVIPAEQYGKHKPTSIASAKHDERVLDRILSRQAKRGKEVKPYQFDMKQVDAFRYRMNDALRAVSQNAVRQARTRELKQELLKSEKLKAHFEENPDDLRHLRHDGELRATRVQAHLKHVPEYLMPAKGRKGLAANDLGFVGMRKTGENRIRRARMHNRNKGRRTDTGARKADPLRSFNAKGRP